MPAITALAFAPVKGMRLAAADRLELGPSGVAGDGREVSVVPELGRPATTANYQGRPIAGRLVEGELAAALSEHLKRPVWLLAKDSSERGADDAPVTLMSEASPSKRSASPGQVRVGDAVATA